MFNFEDCCFLVQKCKETTARIVMWREFNLINSFTLEASFLGPNKGRHANTHFNVTMLQLVGRQFCKTISDYVQETERVNSILNDMKLKFPTGGNIKAPN